MRALDQMCCCFGQLCFSRPLMLLVPSRLDQRHTVCFRIIGTLIFGDWIASVEHGPQVETAVRTAVEKEAACRCFRKPMHVPSPFLPNLTSCQEKLARDSDGRQAQSSVVQRAERKHRCSWLGQTSGRSASPGLSTSRFARVGCGN